MKAGNQRPIGRALLYGVVSLALYALIYIYQDEFMHWTTKGGWYFIFPVMLAFLFSYFHGGFTRYFWEVLGVRAKSPEIKQH
jgi:hypothetical protein